jgi:hypothetical protein
MELTRKSYLRAKADGAPDDVLQLLRDFIADCEELTAPPPDAAPMPPESTAIPQGALPPGAVVQ